MVASVEVVFPEKPLNPLAEMKGLGKGVFGDPVK
jgi:hypothetical protein